MRPTRRITPWLFVAPGLAVFGAAVLLPMVLTAGYSFTEWNGFGPMTFVGLDNIIKKRLGKKVKRARLTKKKAAKTQKKTSTSKKEK